MVELRAHLLGVFRLSVGDRRIPNFGSKKAKSLFAYLLLHRGNMVSREVLAEALWGDHGVMDLRKAFRQELWSIRRALKKGGADPDLYLAVDGDDIEFRADAACWLDIDEFRTIIDVAAPDAPDRLDEARIAALRKAVSLYQGDFLTGIYDEWCLLDREICRDRYITALERLSYYYQVRREWDSAIEQCKRLLHVDSLLEHIHRDLMRCLYARGDRPAALRHFQRCKRLLRRQLDIEPMAETVELYEQIRREQMPTVIETGNQSFTMTLPTRLACPGSSADMISNLQGIRGDIRTAEQQITALIRDVKQA